MARGQKYDALALSSDAKTSGAIEILRAALVDDGVYIAARREFPDASQWGELLAEIARRVALLYSAEDTTQTERDFLVEISEAFVADLGARKVTKRRASRGLASSTARRKVKAGGRSSSRKTSKRTTVKRKR
jgi:hypothetical protein